MFELDRKARIASTKVVVLSQHLTNKYAHRL